MKIIPLFLLIACTAVGCNDSNRSTKSSTTVEHPATVVERDNTAVNERDRNSTAKTPIDQNENKKDIAITADIRKRVVDTKMSVKAQNVKIITQNGKVTLRGPVDTDEEKQQIEDIARDVAGGENVDSQLEVKQSS